jgi:hypothetical protein
MEGRQIFATQTDPIVTHLDDGCRRNRRRGIAILAGGDLLDAQPNLPRQFGKFRCIIEQIRNHADEARPIGLYQNGLKRQVDREFVIAILDQGAADLHCTLNNRRQIDKLIAEFKIAAADSRKIEQAADQLRHLLNLTRDRIRRLADARVGWSRQPDQLDRV